MNKIYRLIEYKFPPAMSAFILKKCYAADALKTNALNIDTGKRKTFNILVMGSFPGNMWTRKRPLLLESKRRGRKEGAKEPAKPKIKNSYLRFSFQLLPEPLEETVACCNLLFSQM